jgi:hypothetical protein
VDTIQDWQDQARLVCDIPNLRGHDAQILVACGWRTAADVVSLDASQALAIVEPFMATREGKRIVRSSRHPDLAEITDWIASAAHGQASKAA